MQLSELQLLLHQEIPLSKTMGAEILSLDDRELCLRIPLSPNRNHKNTVFGGSLYAAGALACYGLFLSGISAEGFKTQNIVIADGQISYKRPVTKDAILRAGWPDSEQKKNFFQQLMSKGKARITLKALIEEDGQLACEFTGRFVAFFP